jgi:hypothetical protein
LPRPVVVLVLITIALVASRAFASGHGPGSLADNGFGTKTLTRRN